MFLRYPVKRVVRKLHVENTRTDELIIKFWDDYVPILGKENLRIFFQAVKFL